MPPNTTGIPLSLLFLLLLAATAGASPVPTRRTLEAAVDHCRSTLHPDLCVSTVAAIPDLPRKTLPQVIASIISRTQHEVHFAVSNCTGTLRRRFRALPPRQRLALNDCLELLGDTIDLLSAAAADLRSPNSTTSLAQLGAVLSAAMTNQDTCLDGFATAAGEGARPSIQARVDHISSMVSNALALATRLPRAADTPSGARRGYPSWLTRRDRRLLQVDVSAMKVDLVVAKDGTGNFTTIGDAVAAAPVLSPTRFVIYIKAGGYFENVEVPNNKTNLMFVGDGMWRTAVKASRNVVDGWTTFRSATVAIGGNGFLARDMSFENMAGPDKHQAVALRASADLTAFYRCGFVGYQDTLYVHSLRQFYRECEIYGTIDFVFGNAAAVLQRCNLYARRPNPNQQNVFIAQGRDDPNQFTGISLQGCKLAAAADLLPVPPSIRTYIARPWKLYSRTVVMQSEIDDVVDPAGFTEWNGTFALDTLYYREFMNFGPGANTSRRVTWAGYAASTNGTEMAQFTPSLFLQGDEWLPASLVPFLFN